MKKTILVTVLLVAISMNMQAQLVKFGIKGGVNYANQHGSDITVNSTITKMPLQVIMQD